MAGANPPRVRARAIRSSRPTSAPSDPILSATTIIPPSRHFIRALPSLLHAVHATPQRRQRARGLGGTEVGQSPAMHPGRRLAAQWRPRLRQRPGWVSSERPLYINTHSLPNACADPHPHPRAPPTTHQPPRPQCSPPVRHADSGASSRRPAPKEAYDDQMALHRMNV
jgi:hypothetical protein